MADEGKHRRRKQPPTEAPEAFVTFDFASLFPHRFWVSNWSKDEEYPGGFRYKLLSVRDEKKDKIILVTVLEELDGCKTEMGRMVASPVSAFDPLIKEHVADMEKTFGIKFEESHLSYVRTEEEFDEVSHDEGWRDWEPGPVQ